MVMLMPMIVLETCVAFPIAPPPEGSCHEVTEGREWEGWPQGRGGCNTTKKIHPSPIGATAFRYIYSISAALITPPGVCP